MDCPDDSGTRHLGTHASRRLAWLAWTNFSSCSGWLMATGRVSTRWPARLSKTESSTSTWAAAASQTLPPPEFSSSLRRSLTHSDSELSLTVSQPPRRRRHLRHRASQSSRIQLSPHLPSVQKGCQIGRHMTNWATF